MKSVDTNILLQLTTMNVPRQLEQVTELLKKSGKGELAVADMVFAEMAWVLAGGIYHWPRTEIANAIRSVMLFDQFNCSRALFERVLPLYVAHPKVSFVDVCLSVYAELNNATPLLTFDKSLAGQVPVAELLA